MKKITLPDVFLQVAVNAAMSMNSNGWDTGKDRGGVSGIAALVSLIGGIAD